MKESILGKGLMNVREKILRNVNDVGSVSKKQDH